MTVQTRSMTKSLISSSHHGDNNNDLGLDRYEAPAADKESLAECLHDARDVHMMAWQMCGSSSDENSTMNLDPNAVVQTALTLWQTMTQERQHQEHMENMRQNNQDNDAVLVKFKETFLETQATITFRWAVFVWTQLGACVVYGVHGEGPNKSIMAIIYQIYDGAANHILGVCPVRQVIKETVKQVVFNTTDATASSYFWWPFSAKEMTQVFEYVVQDVVMEPVMSVLECAGFKVANALKFIGIASVFIYACRSLFGPDSVSHALIFFTVGLWITSLDIVWMAPYIAISMAFGAVWLGYLYFEFYRVEAQLIAARQENRAVSPDDLYMEQKKLTAVQELATKNFLVWGGVLVVTLVFCAFRGNQLAN